MARKRIGVVAAQIDENNQNLFLQGFLNEAFASNFDVCIFSKYLKIQNNPARELGDSNIYNLLDNCSLFDAIIILADTIQTPGIYESIEKKLHSLYKGPVLVVDKESSVFPYIMMDYYTSFKLLIDHLIDEHNYSNIVLLDGYQSHPHSIQRLNAYKDSLLSHNIPINEEYIYYGDYWYTSGEATVRLLLHNHKKLPDAIACANDYMAIGVLKALARNGIRVPEDIAVIGFDSTDEARNYSPCITSALVLFKEFGTYCASFIIDILNGKTMIDNTSSCIKYNLSLELAKDTLLLGNSCGCDKNNNIISLTNDYTTSFSEFNSGFFSYMNHMMEDLLSQTNYNGFFNTVFEYCEYIRDFDNFHICLNDNWDITQSDDHDVFCHGYTENINRVIRCGENTSKGNIINLSDKFDTSTLLPELYSDSTHPCVYIFTPLHFNEKCLGYAVINYGNKPKVYDKVYHLWLRNFMQGLECFNRQYALSSLITKMEFSQIRDSLTGLYNLRGFLNQTYEICEIMNDQNNETAILAIDMNNLHSINDIYGRREGDRAIIAISEIVNDCIKDNEVCCRMCNDEFLISYPYTSEKKNREAEIITYITQRAQILNSSDNINYEISFFFGSNKDIVTSLDVLESIVNDAVSTKNRHKATLLKQAAAGYKLTAEDIENNKIVSDILDNNLFIYHFQPIVSAYTGEIFSYEALMRSNTHTAISPLTIIKCAERMNRLHDIERATFNNVLRYLSENEEYFKDKKVFINSIPGYQLSDEEFNEFSIWSGKYSNNVVIEFTEESEIDDYTLSTIKNNLNKYSIEIAIDDYGAGYSNTNNLLRYMPQYVKIDRLLINDIHDNPQKKYLVKSIIDFAHENDILALAEGVETKQELKEVIKLGVDLIQGFYTCKPQPIPPAKINDKIINEIIQYNQSDYASLGRREYNVTPDEKISLLQLVMGKYSHIVVPKASFEDNTIEIVGAPGFQSNLSLIINDGFTGTIILDTVSFGSKNKRPCIDVGENANVVFILNGDNDLRTGGVHVPESSSITFKGDGSLNISINTGQYYGIGNDNNSKNGSISFEQDGGIVINATGTTGVGIGSGLGGPIAIKRGWYRINLNGKTAVGIGSLDGSYPINIDNCDMEFHLSSAYCVGIGSMHNNADITIQNTSSKMWSSGQTVIGYGSIDGHNVNIKLNGGLLISNIRSVDCYAFGGNSENVDIDISYASINIYTLGNTTYAMGSNNQSAKISFTDSDISTNINNNQDIDFNTFENNLNFINCRCEFKHNENIISRQIDKLFDTKKEM